MFFLFSVFSFQCMCGGVFFKLFFPPIKEMDQNATGKRDVERKV